MAVSISLMYKAKQIKFPITRFLCVSMKMHREKTNVTDVSAWHFCWQEVFSLFLTPRLLAAEHHCQQQGQPLGQKRQQYLEMYKKLLFDCHLFSFFKKHHRSQFSLLLFISYSQCQWPSSLMTVFAFGQILENVTVFFLKQLKAHGQMMVLQDRRIIVHQGKFRVLKERQEVEGQQSHLCYVHLIFHILRYLGF